MSVRIYSAGERLEFAGHCRDLSTAGIGVLIATEVSLGEVAALGFSLPGLPETWNLRAVLRHRRGYHYGFEFLSLSDEQSRALRQYLTKQERADEDSGAALRDEPVKA